MSLLPVGGFGLSPVSVDAVCDNLEDLLLVSMFSGQLGGLLEQATQPRARWP